MNGRERVEAAFTSSGTQEIPAIVCYDWLFYQERWLELSSYPWWYLETPVLEDRLKPYREILPRVGQDWFSLHRFFSKEEQVALQLELRTDGVFLVDTRTGVQERLYAPTIGDWPPNGRLPEPAQPTLPESAEDIDAILKIPYDRADSVVSDGRANLAHGLIREFGDSMYPYCWMSAPMWQCYHLWGYEGWMTLVASRPDLVRHAAECYLTLSIHEVHQAAAMGAAGIFLDECLTDMISANDFDSLSAPYTRQLIREIRSAGLHSIYYFCGNPSGKWETLLSMGADAIAFEESKKGFTIDIEDVVERVGGHCTVLGNLDAITLLEKGSDEDLRSEIARQIAAGRRNDSRFIMSLGSPVTPRTPVERVRLYCDLVHTLGSK